MGSEGQGEARWCANHLPLVVAARIYLLRCYPKNFKTNLTADDKKALGQIAAHLKGLQ